VKRPPDRKLVLAAMALLVAAGAVFSRPAASFTDNGATLMLLFKTFSSGRGGF
jgi:hypothetical protein